MEKRLWSDIERYYSRTLWRSDLAELDTEMSRYCLLEIERRNEVELGLHVMSDALSLYLSSSLQLLGKALR